jgi:hypothetical protein
VVEAGRVTCAAKVGRRRLGTTRRGFFRQAPARTRAAVCTWRIPKGSAGRTLAASLTVRAAGATVRRSVARRVAR